MKLLVLTLVVVLAMSKLLIYSPYDLRDKIDRVNGEIRSSMANVGIVPYGHTIIGNLWMENDNLNGCQEFNKTFGGEFDPDTDPSPIVVV